ncbi:MAG TPA: hypothetical protein VEV17_14320 [Bryobacteraceae bacterium]|nr:hypothetical protein [Bryobacteraceae bacterium]
MRLHTRSLSRLVLVLVPALTLICSSTYAFAQGMPPSGSFGFVVSASYVSPTDTNGWAMLGVMNFDGAGNVTGTYHAQYAGGPPPLITPNPGTFSGTYSSNPDGTGSVMITLDVGFTLTFAIVITDSGNGFQLAATSCAGSGCDITGTLINGFARAANTGGSPVGSYGFQLNLTPNAAALIGVASFDGAGNITFSDNFVGRGQGQPPVSQAEVDSESVTGTYSVNPDGSGAISLMPAGGGQGHSYAMVSVDGGSAVLLLQTNRPGNGVEFGIARLQ